MSIGQMLNHFIDKQEKKSKQNEFYKKYNKKRIIRELDKYEFTLKIERAYFIKLCLDKQEYAEALFKTKNKTFQTSLVESVTKQSNIIGIINGFTRSGKSITAQSILFLIRKAFEENFGIEYPIVIGFTREEMKRFLETVLAPFGMVQDENPNESGKDSQLKLEAIKNISESIRQEQISIIVCTPIKNKMGFVNFRLLMCGTNEKKNMLRAFLFSGESDKPLGIIEIPFHKDLDFLAEYNKKKKEFLKNIKETGGFIISDFDREKADRDIEYWFNYLWNKYQRKLSKGDIIDLMELEGYNETENFKKRIASKIRAKMVEAELESKGESKPKKQKPQIKYDEFGISEGPVMEWEDNLFKETVFGFLKEKLSKQELEVFEGIINQESYRLIAKRILKSSTNTKKIKLIKDKITQNFLGYAGELAYKDLLTFNNINFEYFGSNSPDPDFINHTEKEVISFKCYTLAIDSKAKHSIAQSEIDYAIKHNYKLSLLIYIMQDGIFKKFSVSLPKNLHSPLSKNSTIPPHISGSETPSLPMGV